MGYEEFSVSMTNRSLRTVKAELEFLAENDLITPQQLTTILGQLPTETSFTGTVASPPTAPLNNLSLTNARTTANPTPPVANTYNPPPPAANSYANEKHNEKQNLFADPTPSAPPPAYGSTPAPAPSVLTHAVSLYAYSGTDAGDLSLLANDRIAVTEYMNGEWWKGRNERTGAEGIFPRSYVRVEEKSVAGTPQPSNYGNVPMDVSQGGQGEDPKKKGTASKIGGKLGNAAIFGAGATIGSNLVNSIF